MNALTTTTPIDVDALVKELAGGMKHERGQITLDRLPVHEERIALQARQITLLTAMRSITYSVGDKKSAQLAGAAIAEMLSLLRGVEGQEQAGRSGQARHDWLVRARAARNALVRH